MPSKFNKTKSGKSSKKDEEILRQFTLESEPKFEWLQFKFTLAVSVTLIGIHLLGLILFGTDIFLTIPDEFVSLFAMNNYLILVVGDYYRLLTAIFIHQNIIHLGGNLLFLLIFSIRLEEIAGWKKAFVVFIMSGLGGNILTLLIFGATPILWSLGASGAVNGIFSANLYKMRTRYNKGSLSALSFLIVFSSFTIAGPQSNFFAHLGGLIFGWVTMYLFEKYNK